MGFFPATLAGTNCFYSSTGAWCYCWFWSFSLFLCCFNILGLSSLNDISGSYTNASKMASRDSLLARITRIVFSHVVRKFPSIPDTSIAFISMRVSLKGIFSGNFSLRIAISKQSPKSMCIIFPEYLSSMMFDGWRSPNPNIYPTIDITASDRV